MTSSSSLLRKVMAVPCFPARPVRPGRRVTKPSMATRCKKYEQRTDTMNVCLDRVGHLVVDDQADVLNIDTTTSQVGSDQDVRVARPQGLQRGFSLFLVLARVQGCRAPLRCQLSDTTRHF